MQSAEEFTRREVMESTGTTSNRLQYLERAKLVVPTRVEMFDKTNVLYSFEQLLQVRAIKNLRQQISLQQVRKVMSFLNESGFDTKLYDKQLILFEGEVYWVSTNWDNFPEGIPKALKVASKKRKGVGQYVLLVIPPLINVLSEIMKAAKKSKVIDFERFKEKVERLSA